MNIVMRFVSSLLLISSFNGGIFLLLCNSENQTLFSHQTLNESHSKNLTPPYSTLYRNRKLEDGPNMLYNLEYYKTSTEWWDVHGIFANPYIFLRKIDLDPRKVHSCYEYKVIQHDGRETRSRTFCYASMILTGYMKCSTSALYNLLAQYPTVVKEGPGGKENCMMGRNMTEFFDFFPETVGENEIIMSGCIWQESNLQSRKILREPNVFYLVSCEYICYDFLFSVVWCCMFLFIVLSCFVFISFVCRTQIIFVICFHPVHRA